MWKLFPAYNVWRFCLLTLDQDVSQYGKKDCGDLVFSDFFVFSWVICGFWVFAYSILNSPFCLILYYIFPHICLNLSSYFTMNKNGYLIWNELPRWLGGKELPTNAGDMGSTPEMGISPGKGNGNALQYSCLGNPMGWGVWWARVHGVTKS